MFTHEAPVELQRDHWNLNVIGAVPAQAPGWPVRILPLTGLPVTVGRVVFVGGPVAADALAATSAVASVAISASHVLRPAHLFCFVRMWKCLLPPEREVPDSSIPSRQARRRMRNSCKKRGKRA